MATVVPPNGLSEAGGSSTATLMVDGSALAPGDYDGVLCIASNDPDEPLVAVPFSVTVTPPAMVEVRLPVVMGSPQGGTRER